MSNTDIKFDLGPVRLAKASDIPDIIELITPAMKETFRLVNPEEDLLKIIDCSVLALSQLNKTDEVIGFLAVDDFPLAPALHPSAWEDWICYYYGQIDLESRSNLFIRAFIWSTSYGYAVTSSLIRSVFLNDCYLETLVIYRVMPYVWLTNDHRAEIMFTKVTALNKNAHNVPYLSISYRNKVCPRLQIRAAMEADNDDLVSLLDAFANKLKKIYGAYYISEIISNHTKSSRKLLVAEIERNVVGLMCFNTEINYEYLESNYDLSPYCGLKKIKDSSNFVLRKYEDEPFAMEKKELKHQMNRASVITKCSMKTSKNVNLRNLSESTSSLDATSDETELDILAELAIDDSQYDIVNIDSNLLSLPKSVPYEMFVFGQEDSLTRSSASNNTNEGNVLRINENSNTAAITPTYEISHRNNRLIYNGLPNAFVLELFAMDPGIDERSGFDILRGAFKCFPNLDYCIIVLPTSIHCFNLLQHFTHVTPSPIRNRIILESLYVTHRNSILGKLSVRRAELSDLQTIWTLTDKLQRRDELGRIIEDSLKSPHKVVEPFLILTEMQPAGLVTITKLQETSFKRWAFDMHRSSKCFNCEASIMTAILTPILEPHARWFVREIMRQSDYSNFTWTCRIFGRGYQAPANNLTSLIPIMAPGVIKYPQILNEFSHIDLNNSKALWYIDRPLTSLLKFNVNHKIVVVGASLTAISFLKTLLFGPSSMYLTFTNISLVSIQGLTVAVDYIKPALTCWPDDKMKLVSHLPYLFYVDVTFAKMLKIDRRKKNILLDNGISMYYDKLIISCGKQYQQPIIEDIKPKQGLFLQPERIHSTDSPFTTDRTLPDNLMLVNSLVDAHNCLTYLIRLVNESEINQQRNAQIIIYGNSLRAYTCLASIIEMKLVPLNHISFVEPFPNGQLQMDVRTTCFNNDEIDNKVFNAIKDSGITVYNGWELFNYEVASNRICTVRLISRHSIVDLACIAFFYYGRLAVDDDTTRAIVDSGLVWDGGLIIDSEFKTIDPNIYAAGSITRYSRILNSEKFIHQYYNPFDVGNYMGECFLNMLDPLCQSKKKPCNLRLVPRFTSPLSVYAKLPGGLFYSRTRAPGPVLPVLARKAIGTGRTLKTENDGTLFVLCLKVDRKVENFACLSRNSFKRQNLETIYGKHEKLLGNLLQRFSSGLIDDLLEYFSEPWLSALVYARADDLTTSKLREERSKCYFGSDQSLIQKTKVYASSELIDAVSVELIDAVSVCIRELHPIFPQYPQPLHPSDMKKIRQKKKK